MVWTLSHRASLNAVRRRLAADLIPAPGDRSTDFGLLHGTVAQTLLAESREDDCATDSRQAEPTAAQARKARAQAGAMRLFTQRVRAATPGRTGSLRGSELVFCGPDGDACLPSESILI
ncbi:hypothetical protein ACLMNJ_37865 [Streptomyces seoulensis]